MQEGNQKEMISFIGDEGEGVNLFYGIPNFLLQNSKLIADNLVYQFKSQCIPIKAKQEGHLGKFTLVF